ncbi:MAG: ABC transporter permease [Candidatus Sumerlaeia bacterium]
MSSTASVRRITPDNPAGAESLSFWFPVCIARNWVLLRQLTMREVKSRYESSMLGIFWAFFTPLTSLLIYTFVFGYIFKGQVLHGGKSLTGMFPLFILCGLTAYNIFSESINSSARVIAANANYVKKVVFPLEILPVSNLLAACYFGVIWFLITIAGIALALHRISLTAVCLPLLMIPLLLFCIGLCWIVASLGVYIRDTPHFIGIILLIMLYMTGIFYSPAILPPLFQKILFLNPLAVIVEQIRRVLLFGEWPQWGPVAVVTAVSIVLAQAGYMWFTRTKKGFADVI